MMNTDYGSQEQGFPLFNNKKTKNPHYKHLYVQDVLHTYFLLLVTVR